MCMFYISDAFVDSQSEFIFFITNYLDGFPIALDSGVQFLLDL